MKMDIWGIYSPEVSCRRGQGGALPSFPQYGFKVFVYATGQTYYTHKNIEKIPFDAYYELVAY